MSSRRSLRSLKVDAPSGKQRSRAPSEADETASILSSLPASGPGAGADAESILGDLLITDQRSPGWKIWNESKEEHPAILAVPFDTGEPTADFNREFDEIPEILPDGSNEGRLYHY